MAINFNDSELISTYQEGIDYLINNYGNTVTLIYKPTITNVNSTFNDKIRNTGGFRPDFKTSSGSPSPSVVQNNENITALVQWNPKDFERFGTEIQNPGAVIRLKTFLTDVPKLKKCETIIPDANKHQINQMKFRLVREPVPFGLGVNRYAISFWEEV